MADPVTPCDELLAVVVGAWLALARVYVDLQPGDEQWPRTDDSRRAIRQINAIFADELGLVPCELYQEDYPRLVGLNRTLGRALYELQVEWLRLLESNIDSETLIRLRDLGDNVAIDGMKKRAEFPGGGFHCSTCGGERSIDGETCPDCA